MKYIRVIDLEKGDIELNYIQEPTIDTHTLETKEHYLERKLINIYSLVDRCNWYQELLTEQRNYIKEEAINLKRNNDKLKQENEKLINILVKIKEDVEDITSNYFKRYDDDVYKLCNNILEKIKEVDKE